MKDDLLNSDPLQSDGFRDDFRLLLNSETEVFSDLVTLLGLDPKQDFRFADLDGVDFTGSDIRGFDFTGASLRGAIWGDCERDETTIFHDVDLDEAGIEIRDEVLLVELHYRHLRSLSANEQVIWLYRLKRNDPQYKPKMAAARRLLQADPDGFVARTILEVSVKTLTVSDALAFLDDLVFSKNSDANLMRRGFAVLHKLFKQNQKLVLAYVIKLLGGVHAASAAVFIVTYADLGNPQPIRSLSEKVRRLPSSASRRLYLTQLASKFDELFLETVRSPETGDVFDFNAVIEPPMLDLICRRLRGRMRVMQSRDHQLSQASTARYGWPSDKKFLDNAVVKVLENFHTMNKYGARYYLGLIEKSGRNSGKKEIDREGGNNAALATKEYAND